LPQHPILKRKGAKGLYIATTIICEEKLNILVFELLILLNTFSSIFYVLFWRYATPLRFKIGLRSGKQKI